MKKTFTDLFHFIENHFGATIDPQFFEMMIIATSMLFLGTVFYNAVEGWGVLDSLYFSVTTLTTVGYGDFFPKTDAGKMFTIFYILAGVGILLGFVNAVAIRTRNRSPLDKLFQRKN